MGYSVTFKTCILLDCNECFSLGLMHANCCNKTPSIIVLALGCSMHCSLAKCIHTSRLIQIISLMFVEEENRVKNHYVKFASKGVFVM